MPESVAAFAARIKAKYPDYAEVPDEELTRRVLAKYPDYRDQVTFGPPVADQARASMAKRASGGDLTEIGYAPDSLDKTFMGGVKDQLIPSGHQLKTLARASFEVNPATGPLAAAYDYATGQKPAAGEIAKGIGQAHLNEARKAIGGPMQGNDRGIMERLGHGVAAVLPVVGPAAAAAGEDIKGGDIAYGLGEGAALVGSLVAPEAAVKGVKAVTPSLKITRAAGFADNLARIAAASPDAPTLTSILKTAGKEAKDAGMVGLVSELPGVAHLPYMKELLVATGTVKGAMAAYKALRDLPKTAAFKAASVTTKTQFAKALTTGQIADAITIGGRIVAGETAMNTMVDAPERSGPSPGAEIVLPGGSANAAPASGRVRSGAPATADNSVMPADQMGRYRRMYRDDPESLLDENPTAYSFFDDQYGAGKNSGRRGY